MSQISAVSQDFRSARVVTPLGKDALLLVRFECSEAIGELFEVRAEVLSERSNIDLNEVLGRNASIHLETVDGVGRDFCGVVTEGRWLGPRGRYSAYSLVMRPWLWLLSLTSDCRIFSNKAPIDIIQQIFRERGFSDQVINLVNSSSPTLEYCVQYRETDLNFVLRLMEEYGIYYYFQFKADHGILPGSHHLVLANSVSYANLPGLPTIPYLPADVGQQSRLQRLDSWTKTSALVTGVFTLNDYDYEKPSANLLSTADYPYEFTHGDMEIYNYPGDFTEQDEGTTLAKVNRDVERTRNERYVASGYAPTLTPGYAVARNSTGLSNSGDGEYVVLRCSHAFGSQSYETGGQTDAIYYGTYELAKGDVPYRMPARTRRPVIAGTQSALVVGQQGEEIDVDKEGRICVQFYWDRKKTASRRVRVAQFWAGKLRGALFLPRIGDEVVVQYEEGNPDRPLVVGSVYNGTNTVSATMPDRKNISGILTLSTKNKPKGYNNLVFDDTAGQERVKIRAERDLMVKALHDETRVIGNSQTESIGGDLTQSVGGDQSLSVGSMDPPGGGTYTLTATQQIVLTVESSSITITPEGITIQAPMIYLNP